MDRDNNNAEVVNSSRSVDCIRDLKLIDPKAWPPERLEWLWQHVKEEKYACDDPGENNAALFLANLFNPCTEHYEYGDASYWVVLNIVAGINADIHFCHWDDVSVHEVKAIHDYIYRHLVEVWDIHRTTAYVPEFNQQAKRVSLILGYKFEGCAREMFLKGKRFFDLNIFGLLRSDFERKRGV